MDALISQMGQTSIGLGMVEFIVGESKHSFTAHKSILFHKIPYFEVTLTEINEGDLGKDFRIEFPHFNVNAFHIFLTWLHTDTLPTLEATFINGQQQISYSWQPEHLYSIFEKFRLFHHADCIMDGLIECHRRLGAGFDPEAILWIFKPENTGYLSPLRKYALCWIFWDKFGDSTYKLIAKNDSRALLKVEEVREAWDLLDHADQTIFNTICPSHRPHCKFHWHWKTAPCSRQVHPLTIVLWGGVKNQG
ncbi:hypothetical protein NHQ30_008943 [Ciborinia camelliae]|nr:hypothetical protein NHQ30_008943 [Ciborinia camelliae]